MTVLVRVVAKKESNGARYNQNPVDESEARMDASHPDAEDEIEIYKDWGVSTVFLSSGVVIIFDRDGGAVLLYRGWSASTCVCVCVCGDNRKISGQTINSP